MPLNDYAIQDPNSPFAALRGTETPLADQSAGLRRIGDLGVDIASGLALLPQAAAAVIPGMGGAAQAIADARKSMGDALYSDVRQAEQQRLANELQAAEGGFGNEFSTYINAAIRDPALLAGTVAQTLPGLGASSLVARGLAATSKLSAPVRAAIGEGVVAGGMTAAGIGEQGGDYFQRLAGIPAGIATGAIAGGANRLIGKMSQQNGLVGALGRGMNEAGDIDIALAGAASAGAGLAGKGSLVSRMAFGGLREGVFEELPQSLSEQTITNLALGNDIGQGLGEAAAAGLLAGSAMGAGFSALQGIPNDPVTKTDPVAEARATAKAEYERKQAGVKTKAGNPFKTEAAAKGAIKRQGLDPEKYEIVPVAGQPLDPNVGNTQTSQAVTGFTIVEKAQTQAQVSAEYLNTVREAARAAITEEMGGTKGLGTKAIDAVMGITSIEELDALPGKVLNKTRKEQIKNLPAFQEYIAVHGKAKFGDQFTPYTPPVEPTAESVVDPVDDPANFEDPTGQTTTGTTGQTTTGTTDQTTTGTTDQTTTGATDQTTTGATDQPAAEPAQPKTKKAYDTTTPQGAADAILDDIDEFIKNFDKDNPLQQQALEETLQAMAPAAPSSIAALKQALDKVGGRRVAQSVDAVLNGRAKRVFDAKNSTQAVQKDLLPLDGMVALMQLYRGFTLKAAEDAANPEVSSGVGSDQNKATIRNARMAAKIFGADRNDPNSLGTKLNNLFEQFFLASTDYERMVNAYGVDSELVASQKTANRIYANEDLTPAELDMTGAAGQRVLRQPSEGNVAEQDALFKQLASQLQQRRDQMTAALEQIEHLVGRDNLRLAQFLAKRETAVRRTQEITSLQGGNAGETSEAIRFSMYARQFRAREGETLLGQESYTRDPTDVFFSENVGDLASVVYRAGSTTGESVEQFDANGNAVITNRPRMADIIDQILADGRATTPVEAVLEHYARTSTSPYIRAMANRFRKLGAESRRPYGTEGKLDKDLFSKIQLEIIPSDTVGTARANIDMLRLSNFDGLTTLRLAASGQNEVTVMHELVHIFTDGFIREGVQRFKETGNLSPMLQDLDDLRNEFVTALKSIDVEIDQAIPVEHSRHPEFRRMLEQQAARVGTSPKRALNRIFSIAEPIISHYGHHELHEFVAYGLTSPLIQEALATIESKKETYKTKKRNLWQIFSAKLLRLLGLISVPNSIMQNVMNATNAIFSEAYQYSENDPEAFATDDNVPTLDLTALRKARSSKQSTGDLDAPLQAAFDPSIPPEDMKAEAERRASTAGQNNGQSKAEEQSATWRKEKREAEQAKARAGVEARLDAVAQEKASTAVPLRGKAPKQNVTWFDQMGQTTMNAMASLFGRETWSQLMDDAGNWSQRHFANFISQDNKMAAAVRKVVVNTVDKYGTTDAFRNIIHEYAKNRQNVDDTAYASYEALKNLDLETSQAVLDYIDNGDEAVLRSKVGDQDKADLVLKTVQGMELLLAEAKRLGIMREGQENAELKDIISLTRNPNYRRKRGQAAGNVGLSQEQRAASYKDVVINSLDVLDKNGKVASGAVVGKQYMRLVDKVGTVFYAEKGIDEKIVRDRNLTYDANDQNLFRATKVLDGGDIRMSRRLRAEEISRADAPAQVMPSIIATMQDMARRVEGSRMTSGMVAAQAQYADDAKWVLDEKPKGDIAGRFIDLNNENVIHKDALAEARRPGTWVRVPEDAMWGDLAGKWMAGPAYASMHDFFNEDAMVNKGAFASAMRTWKKFKTVYSPVAHINNVMGNFLLAYYHDLPVSQIAEAAKIIFGGNLTPQQKALLEEFKSSGATLGGFDTNEVNKETQLLANQLGRKHKNTPDGARGLISVLTDLQTLTSVALNKGMSAAQIIDDKAAAVYSNQDNVFRLAAYMTRLQQINARKGSIDANDKDEAARYAKESFVDYAITAPWIVNARNNYLPFVAWPYRMVPLLFKLMLHKPWKAAATMGAISALNTLFVALAGDTPEGDDEKRELMDEYMKYNIWGMPGVPSYIRLPWGTEDNPQYFGIGRMVPLSDLFNPANNGIPQTVNISGPLFTVFNALNNYDPFTQKQISDPTVDTAGEQFWKRAVIFTGKDMIPNVMANGIRTVDRLGLLSSEKLGPTGSEPNAVVELSRLMGLNVRQMNVPDQRVKQSNELQRIKRAFAQAKSAAMRSELRRGDPNVDAIYREMLDLNAREISALNAELGLED